MPSDAQVPAPIARGLTVPAAAVVVLVLLGAGWGIGMFLLGRYSVVLPVAADPAAAHLGWLNRLDQGLARGDLAAAEDQLRTPLLPDDALGQTALTLRRARLAALSAERVAAAAAVAPAAVLGRLQASLSTIDPALVAPAVVSVAAPATAPPPAVPASGAAQPGPAAIPVPPAPAPVALAEETLGDQRFIPLARIAHPTLAKRAYAIHPARGLLRSDDAGATWRSGLAPLAQVTGRKLLFTSGEHPLLVVVGETCWLFADGEDAFFP